MTPKTTPPTDAFQSARDAAILIALEASRIVATYREDAGWLHDDELTLPTLEFSDFLRDVILAERAVQPVRTQILASCGSAEPKVCGNVSAQNYHDVATRFGRIVGGAIWQNLWVEPQSDDIVGDALKPWPVDGIDSGFLQLCWEEIRDGLREITPIQFARLEVAIRNESAMAAETASPPAVEKSRLQVDLKCYTVTLDGKTYRVDSENALRWLKVLADNPGVPLSSRDLEKHDSELVDVRTDQLRHHLPREIDRLIEAKPGKGSRLTL